MECHMQHLNIDERGPIYSMLLRPFSAGKRIHRRSSTLPPQGENPIASEGASEAGTTGNGCISMQPPDASPAGRLFHPK